MIIFRKAIPIITTLNTHIMVPFATTDGGRFTTVLSVLGWMIGIWNRVRFFKTERNGRSWYLMNRSIN